MAGEWTFRDGNQYLSKEKEFIMKVIPSSLAYDMFKPEYIENGRKERKSILPAYLENMEKDMNSRMSKYFGLYSHNGIHVLVIWNHLKHSLDYGYKIDVKRDGVKVIQYAQFFLSI